MADERPPRPEGQDQRLRRLEEQLGRATEAAERLISEARSGEGRGRGETKPPPAGWQQPADQRPAGAAGGELHALIAALGALCELIPPDVAERLANAFRELLLALRALIDSYLERLERRRTEPPAVEDIPIQ